MKTLLLLTVFAISTNNAFQVFSYNLRPPRYPNYVKPARISSLLTNDYKEPGHFENTQYRKHLDEIPIIIVKSFSKLPRYKVRAKYPIKGTYEGQELKGGNYEKKKYYDFSKGNYERTKDLDTYDKLFNDKGMLYLTPRKNDDERKLNSLMNKVIEYKMDQEKKYLRTPLSTIFKPEIELKTIVKANSDDKTPKTSYDFAELVA